MITRLKRWRDVSWHNLKRTLREVISASEVLKLLSPHSNSADLHLSFFYNMSNGRRNRLPVSCEPCRKRKIRCSRDNPPCATCVRRRLRPSQCIYVCQNSQNQSIELPVSSVSASSVQSNELVTRVAKLEQLLQEQQTLRDNLRTAASPIWDYPSVSNREYSCVDNHLNQPIIENSRSHDRLINLASGHLRYIPFAWTMSPTNDASGELDSAALSIDTSPWPTPLNLGRDQGVRELLALLPPAVYCTSIKNAFFESFTPVCQVSIRMLSIVTKGSI
jgi:hypothetical protein